MKSDVVYIGSKPTMSYVMAITTQIGQGIEEISIKARGRAISKAVDVVEIVRNKHLQDLKVKDIKIGTDQVNEKDKDGKETGKKINLSTIEIVVTQ